MASAQPGTLLACFSTAVLPAIRVGAAKRKTCQNGKFQGMTARIVPSGRNTTLASTPGNSTGSGARNRSARSA